MSAINVVEKKKPGRPPKIQPEPLPVAASVNVDAKEQARKAVEEILSQASVQASKIEATPVSIDGAKTGASSHDNLERAQEDYIPGTRVLDLQMVPNRAYDEDQGVTRALGLPNDYHYCWVHDSKITGFKINGYKFVQYNGGVGSGLASNGFSGTGIYEKTFDNRVRNGDMVLMWCSLRQYEVMLKEDFDFLTRMDSASENEIHNDGYRRGIRTFKEVNGVTLYN